MSQDVNDVAEAVTQLEGVEATTTLRHIPEGEKFSARTEVDADSRMVRATFAIRKSEGQPRYEKRCVFDFRDVSEEQLLQLAMYGVKVSVQSDLRKMSDRAFLYPATFANVNVLRDVIEAQRRSVDPATLARRGLNKMSPEDIAALITEYTADKADNQ